MARTNGEADVVQPGGTGFERVLFVAQNLKHDGRQLVGVVGGNAAYGHIAKDIATLNGRIVLVQLAVVIAALGRNTSYNRPTASRSRRDRHRSIPE